MCSIFCVCWQLILIPLITLIFFFGEQLWKRFRGEDKPPAHLGASRDYNVDMVPKV
jgi:hypothetical protein